MNIFPLRYFVRVESAFAVFFWGKPEKKQNFEQPSICKMKLNLIARFAEEKKIGVKVEKEQKQVNNRA